MVASPPLQARDERGWLIDDIGPSRRFGSALPPETNGEIVTPERITIRPMRLRNSPPCPMCGNRGRFHCACEVEE